MGDAGLVNGPGALEAFLRTVDHIGLAALTYPYAAGRSLDLAADTLGLAFVMDDQLSGPGERAPGLVARIIEDVTAVTTPVQGTTSAPAAPVRSRLLRRPTPFVRVWLRLWRELCEGMSPDWQARSARNWTDFFATFPVEDHNHRNGIYLDIDRYRALRRISVGVEPLIDVAERVGGFEVPARVQDSAWMRRLRSTASDVIAVVNDVHGVEREESHRDAHNLVLLLEHHGRLRRDEAIDEAVRMFDRQLAEFISLYEQVPRLCAPLDLTGRERDAVERFTEALCLWISGSYTWSVGTNRYALPTAQSA
ncbi:terpene synthase family protein [Streptomyces regalis]|uniref:Terpene synthase n=1 Tax=Streptomyces regalis TaxID=68262 RepID=A0A117MMD9_9ACTN|nr:hypothetical protein [Streptomyces regalis]KUL25359.1 hypothetical protein ADL12_35115 [Streptomyces regalis]